MNSSDIFKYSVVIKSDSFDAIANNISEWLFDNFSNTKRITWECVWDNNKSFDRRFRFRNKKDYTLFCLTWL